MYYYIFNNRKIVAFPNELNLLINHGFVPLTEEQTAFYLANPNATIYEIINCQLNEPYTPPEPNVQDYASIKLKELKEKCYGTVTVTSLEYAMANATLAGTSLLYTGERYYSTNDAKGVMKEFMDEAAAAMELYDTYAAQIRTARTVTEIDTIMSNAENAINGNNA